MKARRRNRVLELIAEQAIHSQEQLQQLLEADGIPATQTTLSRDLTDLGVWKGPNGYTAGNEVAAPKPSLNELRRTLNAVLLSMVPAQNLVILRTGPGRANTLAWELDRAQLSLVLGTIAGDDTIFIATASHEKAGELIDMFNEMMGES
ncbi:MAG: hypothetical protein HYV16_16180 [Gammaproteobacteria bacterium]|nr:hypothetical protein [Gammaproteobacteria bacterium]